MMEIFVVNFKDIEGRLDPHFYNPIFRKNVAKIKKSKHEQINRIVNFSNEIWNQEDFYDEKFPYIEIGGIDTDTGEIKNISLIIKKDAPSRAKMIVRNRDIIVSLTRPNRGAISFIDKNKDGFIASTGFAVLRDLKTNEVKKEYLFYSLRQDHSLLQMLQRSSGGNYPAIIQDELGKILIPIPSDEIQQKIIHIMDEVYSRKKQNEKEAEKLYNSIDDYLLSELGINKITFKIQKDFTIESSHLLTKRIDPFYHQPIFEKNKQSILNCKYDTTQLNEITDLITSGQRPQGGVRNISEGIPSLGGEHINDIGFVKQTNLKYIPEEFHISHLESKVFPKDILLVKDGATTGKVGFVPENYPFEEVNINEHLFIIRIKDGFDPFYIFCFLKSTASQIQIKREITGATITGLVRDCVEKLLIPIPLMKIQKKISSEIKQQIERAEKLKSESKNYFERAKEEIKKILFE